MSERIESRLSEIEETRTTDQYAINPAKGGESKHLDSVVPGVFVSRDSQTSSTGDNLRNGGVV